MFQAPENWKLTARKSLKIGSHSGKKSQKRTCFDFEGTFKKHFFDRKSPWKMIPPDMGNCCHTRPLLISLKMSQCHGKFNFSMALTYFSSKIASILGKSSLQELFSFQKNSIFHAIGSFSVKLTEVLVWQQFFHVWWDQFSRAFLSKKCFLKVPSKSK